MTRSPRIVAVEAMGGHRLRLRFSDDLVRELDFEHALTGGVFEQLHDESYFAEVSIDATSGTICWPNGVDLDPDVLHGDHPPASGSAPRVLREFRLRPTA